MRTDPASETRSPADELLDFLRKEVIVDPALEIDVRTRLVTTGLVDSFALIELLSRLEQVTCRKIPTGRISPQDLDSVELMLEVAERLGAPK